MRRRRGSGNVEKEEAEKWEKILADEGLASLPDSVESEEPTSTEFEKTSEAAQYQPPVGDADAEDEDLPTFSNVDYDEDVDEDDESIALSRQDINIIE
jgi:hypothetical protein